MKKSGLIVISFFLLLYILPLGVRPMIVPDETRYAEMGREMVETGNWIVPRIDGLRYFEKPILGYWLHALSIKLLGTNAYAVRLPSALAVGLSALILFFFVRRFTSDAVTAIAATVVFLTCLEVYGVGTFCVLDSIFSMFVTATMVLFFFAFTETHSSKKRIFLLSAGIACGLAFLTKGFLAFVIPAVAIIPFAIWQRRFKE
jgi:4-amino-4-deoxy-L-arabinose transferase